MSTSNVFLPLRDGTQIAIPNDPTLMSHFVLSEQGDWFEDEIHFVRQLIQPGMQILDIGANYGVYANSMMLRLQGKGHVYCFEPTPATAEALRQSIARNGFTALSTVIEAGLSDHQGEATFYLSNNSELNSLSKTDGQESIEQTIKLRTLDDCMEEFAWQTLDFIKLDAEGEETRILQAGQKTLGSLSPLVMFELKHSGGVNTELIEAFQALGYQCYRLIPGLNALLPVQSLEGMDSYQLNLFACKADRAEKLAQRGLLITEMGKQAAEQALQPKQIPALSQFEKLRFLAESDAVNDQRYFELLRSYLASRDLSLSINQRYAHLRHAMDLTLQAMQAQDEGAFERLASMARVAFDMGERRIGVGLLEFIIKRYFQQNQPIAVRDAFVPPDVATESLRITSNPVEWLCAGIMDAMVRKHSYSIYFSGATIIPLLKNLESSPYLHPDIAQRIAAVKAAMHAAQTKQASANS